MGFVADVDPILDFPVDRRHDISDLETDTTDFNKVFFLEAVARHFHLRAAVVSDHPPNLLLGLLLKNLIYVLVDVVFMENPVRSILVHQARYDLVPHLLVHLILPLFKEIASGKFCCDFGFGSVDTMAAPDFELLLLEELPFALLHFEVEEAMGLACPSDRTNGHLRHFLLGVLWCGGGHALEAPPILM